MKTKKIFLAISSRRQDDGSYKPFEKKTFLTQKQAYKYQQDHTGWRGCLSRSYFKVDIYGYKLADSKADSKMGAQPTQKQHDEFMKGFEKCDKPQAYGWEVKY